MRTGVWATWGRACLRGRLAAVVALGVLAGATAGLAMAAVDGARRTMTVVDRVSEATLQPDAMVLPNRPGFDWSEIRALPEVDVLGRIVIGDVCATDLVDPEEPYGLCAYPPGGGFPSVDDVLYRDVEVPVLAEGRLPAPGSVDEVAVSRSAVERFGLSVGDRFAVSGPTPEAVEAMFDRSLPPPEQDEVPPFDVTVVGILDKEVGPWDRFVGLTEPIPALLVGSGLLDAHGIGYFYVNAIVRLAPGATVDDLRAAIGAVTGDPTINIRDLAEDRARYERGLQIESTALVLFALAVVVAGVFLIGQAVQRTVAAGEHDAGPLVVLGATPVEHRAALALPGLVVAGIAAVLAPVVAVGLSPLLPVGTTRDMDLDSGVHVDVPVLVVGTALGALVFAALAVLAAARVVRPVASSPPASVAGRAIRGLGLPVPVDLGVRSALVRVRGRAGLPVRPALIGAVVGVLGIVGALTFRAGLDEALADPGLAGTTWSHMAWPTGEPGEIDLADLPGVDGAAVVLDAKVDVEGRSMTAWSHAPVSGTVERTLLAGRVPASADEAILGAASARLVGAGVGDVVELATAADVVELTVVGVGLLPEIPAHSSYDEGVWLTADGFERLGLEAGEGPILLIAADGADPEALGARVAEAGFALDEPLLPSATKSLGGVRSLPVALAGFLVVLAVAALAHSLWSTVRRRARDLAVLRTFGLTPGQVRTAVAAQATAVAAVGVVVGVPVGVLVGRAVWRWVAHALPILYADPWALTVVLVVPAALLLANVIGLRPASVAARQRPAEQLRTE